VPPTPEQLAREKIDALLVAAGWAIQDYRAFNPSAARGIALREVPLSSGRCDYLLLVDRVPLGVIEAKKEGTTLSTVSEQSAHYGENLPDFLANLLPGTKKIPFAYESTGVETLFRDERDPEPRSRRVFAFHQPATLAAWLTEPDTLRARLAVFPAAHPLPTTHLRACQIEAITALEASFAADHPRALIQMATGAGKTYTACAFTYRLIKFAGARRVLFLVDRGNLGKQAKGEFDQFVAPDTGRKFTEVYNVQHLTSNSLDTVARVTICTIQRLYSILRGEAEFDEDLDEKSAADLSAADARPKDVAYNAAVPLEAFDFSVTDECHRSIYGLWRQVLEYFDAHLIGLTATPSQQTVAFFRQNLVMEYTHERAVADRVNVGYEVYRIKTEVTARGGLIEKGFYIDRRSKETRARRLALLDEDLPFAANELDRSVVVESQIRTVLTAYRDALGTDLFPGRTLVPKTLIFAKDDSHAEDIVFIVREVFGRGNDFAKKITYKSYNPETKRYEKSENLIAEFRTSPTLRIAVTVDMIATGTDIKPLEVLLFMRDVRSRTFFEQMKGRGTRVLTPTDLQAVSGEDARAKTHFVIVDAVGVCESDKTESRPLERQPTVAFPTLLLGVALGKRDEDTLTTLAGRLTRLDQQLNRTEAKKLSELTGGKSLGELAKALLNAFDPDVIATIAGRDASPQASASDALILPEPTPAELAAAQRDLLAAACAPFDNPVLRDALAKAKQDAEQTIDTVTVDRVEFSGFDAAAKEKAASLTQSFRAYLEAHKAEIAALQILYSRPYAQRLTEDMLKDLEAKLKQEPTFGPDPVNTVWRAFEQIQRVPTVSSVSDSLPHTHRKQASDSSVSSVYSVGKKSGVRRFADLVALVRFALSQQPVLEPFADSVQARFDSWLAQKQSGTGVSPVGSAFTPEQLAWLRLIADHIATSLAIETEDFGYSPFAQRGGLGRAHQLFGAQLPTLLDELNHQLVA
jgi:type I restriction enzyme R subunit